MTSKQSKKCYHSPNGNQSLSLSIILWITLSLLSNSVNGQETTKGVDKIDETQIIASDSDETDTSTGGQSSAMNTNLPSPLRLEKQKRDLLAALRTPPMPKYLNAGNQTFLSFWQEDLSGTPFGAILLLHDVDEMSLSPLLLNIHQNLPEKGWSTLSIELPRPMPSKIPKRIISAMPTSQQPLDKTEKNSIDAGSPKDETKVVFDDTKDADTEDAIKNKQIAMNTPENAGPTETELQQQAMDYIQAAMEFLQQQGQYNIVILGEGSGAIRALEFTQITDTQPAPKIEKEENNTVTTAIIDRSIRALVLVNIQYGLSEHRNSILELFDYKNIPTLDIYTYRDSNSKRYAKERKLKAQKNKVGIYRQKRLAPSYDTPSTNSETQITKTIRGFLELFAKGKTL